jgi:hypothetical protein
LTGRARRETWLAAIFTALFVLQAPLCAAACLGAADATSGGAAEAPTSPASGMEHGCHDASPAPDPADPPSAHEDCGCDLGANALVSQANDLPTASPSACLPFSFDTLPCDGRPLRDLTIVGAIDLPPPDILLLHSILII